jgi:hypothetical protein
VTTTEGRARRRFLAGASFVLLSAGLLAARGGPSVRADHSRVFELRVYHAVAGKLPVMEARFRDTTSRLLAKHHLEVLGYWTSSDPAGSDPRFVFLLAHGSREEATQNWAAFRADAEFQEVAKAEESEKTLEKAEVVFMDPTAFSPMK